MTIVKLRAYDRAIDRDQLWACKRRFETGLAEPDSEKAAAYEAKLTEAYRRRWLDWVDRCVDEQPRTVTVADRTDDDRLAGYVFLLPESLAFVWDGAVLNEIYVRPAARGTGVADRLVERAVELAREQRLPMDRLLLDVDYSNDRARAFYERHGFTEWGEMLARPLE